MSDIILSQILSGYNLAEVNRNFQIIQDTLNKLMLRKDGENAILSGNLDVNGQALLNVGDLEINGISVLDGVNQIESAYSRIVEELEDYSYKLQDIINKSIEAGAVDRNHTNNVQATWTLSSVVSVGSTLTLPYHYTVGKNTLHLSYNNFYRMYKGIDYDEVGDIGEQSNQIVVKRTAIPTGARMEMWVEAGSEMMQILEAVIEAKETLETYNVDLINSFITAVSDAQNAQLETTLTNATNAANDLASQTSNANTLRAEIQSMIDSINSQSEVISFYYNSLNSLYEGLLAIQNSNIDLSRLQESVEGLVEAASTITTSLDSAIEAAEVATEAKELAVDSKNLSVDAKNTAVSSANSARIWAEGEDVEVAGQGGEHSSKKWALIASDAKELAEEYKNDASASANEAATSSELAGTYAQNAHDDYIAIQSVADSLENAVEEAQQILDQSSEIQDSINLDLEKSRLYVEGTDEELLAYGIEDVEHSAKVWNLLVQENAEEYAGFDVQNYYTKEEVDNITDGIEDQLPSFIKKNGSTTIEGSLHFETAGHDIIDVDKVPSGDYRDIVFKNSDGTKRIAVTRISNLANGGKEISFAPINNANSYGKAFVVGMDASDNFYVKADNSTVITEDNIEDYLIDALPDQTGQSGKVLGTDGTEVSWVSPPSGRNLHEWVWSSLPLTDAGLHLADGAFIPFGGVYDKWARDVERIKNAGLCPESFVTQAEFDASVSEHGSCGKFVVSASGVRLPKVSDILQGTTDLSAVGDLVVAGLPNITASWRGGTDGFILPSFGATGAVIVESQSGYGLTSMSSHSGATLSNTTHNSFITLNASRSSPYYKDSVTKPTPQTIKSLLYICVATSVKTPVEVEIDEIATDLNGKLDKSGGTMTGRLIIEKQGDGSTEGGEIILGANGASNDVIIDNFDGSARIFLRNGSDIPKIINITTAGIYEDGKRVESINELVSNDTSNNGGYVRFASGLQMCWVNQFQGTWSFQKAFNKIPAVLISPSLTNANPGSHVASVSTTSCAFGFGNAVNGYILAIGTWK